MDVEAIQQGLADAASVIDGLECYPALPGAIVPPVFAPVEFEMAYHGTFSVSRGLTTLTFTCGVYAPDTDEGRQILVGFLSEDGDASIPAALEADKTLGDACKTLVVERVRGAYRLYEVGGVEYLGAMIDITIWA